MGQLSFWATRKPFFPFTECDLPFITLTHSAFPLLGLIRHVVLCIPSFAHHNYLNWGIPTKTQLPIWRQYDRHWQTLTQLTIGPKPSLFFSNSWYLWCQPRLQLYIRRLTWQHSPTAYAYPQSVPLGFTWADLWLWWSSRLWLQSVWHGSLKVFFPTNHNPKYIRSVQSFISSTDNFDTEINLKFTKK